MNSQTDERPYYYSCPHCGNGDHFYRVQDEMPIGLGIYHFGGLLLFSSYADSIRRRVQCGRCGRIFRRPRLPMGWIARFIIIFWIVVLAAVIATVLYRIIFPETSVPWLEYCRQLLFAYPYELLGGLVLAIILSPAVVFVSNLLRKRRFGRVYRIEPTSYLLPPAREEGAHD